MICSIFFALFVFYYFAWLPPTSVLQNATANAMIILTGTTAEHDALDKVHQPGI